MPSSLRIRFAQGAKDFLDRISVKLGLSLAIVVSLIPYEGTAGAHLLDVVFLSIFGIEFVCRIFIVTTRITKEGAPASGRKRAGELFMLVLDLFALLSFVPWTQTSENARVLRLVRLARLLLLVKYWGSLVRDIWTVLVRTERARQLLLMGFAVAILSFCGAVVLQAIGSSGADINADGQVTSEDGHFGALLWWAFRQVQDPGNMLQSPLGLTVLLVSTTLTVFGLFLVSFLIGLGTDVVRELMELSRTRPVGYRDHTVVIGVQPTTETLLRELVGYYKGVFRVPRYVVLGRGVERPDFLSATDLGRIAYRGGNSDDPGFLARVDIGTARRVVIQADDAAKNPDAETTSLLLSTRQTNPTALVVAEILERSNVTSAQVAGGSGTVLMPVEEFLALFVSAATENNRRTDLVSTLVTSAGCELYSFRYGWSPRTSMSAVEHRHIDVSFNDFVGSFVASSRGERIAPVGLIRNVRMLPTGGLSYELDFVGSRGNEEIGEVAGFIALGENFEAIQRGGLATITPPNSPETSEPLNVLDLLGPLPKEPPLRRALVCGFRPATVPLCELLIRKNPGLRINVLVSDERHARHARHDLQSYHRTSQTLHRNVGTTSGGFEAADDGLFRFASEEAAAPLGTVQVVVGDWTDQDVLSDLPFATTHVGEHDLVVLMEEPGRDSDGRTAQALLKMVSLELADRCRFEPRFRLVAVVNEEPLGLRLQERYTAALPERTGKIHVLSARSFRSFCLFQATVVPGFEAIYTHLLGPSGYDIFPLIPRAGIAESTQLNLSFTQLSDSLRANGYTLLGLQLTGIEAGKTILICPGPGEPGDTFSLSDIHTVWVIGKEDAGQ